MLQRNNTIGGLGKRTTDPNEKNTWDVAKKLGVAQELNLASEDVKKDFANGVKNAANVVKFKNLDTDHPDVFKVGCDSIDLCYHNKSIIHIEIFKLLLGDI